MPEGAEVAGGAPVQKPYVLSVNRRFTYVGRYNILKRLREQAEHPLVKKARRIIMKMTGRKEERVR